MINRVRQAEGAMVVKRLSRAAEVEADSEEEVGATRASKAVLAAQPRAEEEAELVAELAKVRIGARRRTLMYGTIRDVLVRILTMDFMQLVL